MRVAIIDIGTNSTRLMVADPADGTAAAVHRESQVTRLGRGVDACGRLSAEAMEEVCGVISRYVATARELGARKLEAIATSAVRDSANGEDFLVELDRRFGLAARAIDGVEEARLTYLGATGGRRTLEGDDGDTLVCDIGGGSTELVRGRGAEINFHASLQCGVVRQQERHLHSDPPRSEELERLAVEISELIAAGLLAPEISYESPAHGIAVAGTPTSLAAIELELEPYDPDRVHGHVLELAVVQRICSQLAAMPLAERQQVVGLQAGRAPTIVAGVVILIGVMRAFALDRIEVSEHDILHGAAAEAIGAVAPLAES